MQAIELIDLINYEKYRLNAWSKNEKIATAI